MNPAKLLHTAHSLTELFLLFLLFLLTRVSLKLRTISLRLGAASLTCGCNARLCALEVLANSISISQRGKQMLMKLGGSSLLVEILLVATEGSAGEEKVSERAFWKTSVLAMNQHPRNGYRHNIMATSTSKLTIFPPIRLARAAAAPREAA